MIRNRIVTGEKVLEREKLDDQSQTRISFRRCFAIFFTVIESFENIERVASQIQVSEFGGGAL